MPRSSGKFDLSHDLAAKIKGKRVLCLIDGGNLYHAAYKKKLNVDFEQFITWFKENTDKKMQMYYYSAFDPDDEKQVSFMDGLKDAGYKMHLKPIRKVAKDVIKGNLDVELTVDAIRLKRAYDVLVLISGDGDFTYLLQYVEKTGKQTMVLGIAGFMSFELHNEADNYYFFDRIKQVWRTPRKKKGEEEEDKNSDDSNEEKAKSQKKPHKKTPPKKPVEIKIFVE
jgi:uncharacterized protein (TIGR00288 family)